MLKVMKTTMVSVVLFFLVFSLAVVTVPVSHVVYDVM